jgi:hypothetical protein
MTQASPGVRKSKVASELISFHLSISLLSSILHGWSITSLFPQGYMKTYMPLFRKSLLLASMSRQTHLIDLGGFASRRKMAKHSP